MEPALVENARAGDRAAFDSLVRSRIDAMYRTSLAVLGDEADAADAVQETFISAWRHCSELRDPDLFDAWLGRINLNACRDQLRRRGRKGVREIRLRRDGALIARERLRPPLEPPNSWPKTKRSEADG